MTVQTKEKAKITDEYGCNFRRIYPWEGVVDPKYWGGAWAYVQPGKSTTKHSHDEHETFVITSGQGEISINDEKQSVKAGDVIYLKPFSEHTIQNTSDKEELAVLCIWWGGKEADEKIMNQINKDQKTAA